MKLRLLWIVNILTHIRTPILTQLELQLIVIVITVAAVIQLHENSELLKT